MVTVKLGLHVVDVGLIYASSIFVYNCYKSVRIKQGSNGVTPKTTVPIYDKQQLATCSFNLELTEIIVTI